MERFEQLFRLPDNLYAEGSPLIISAGALLLDRKSRALLVQLKFHNVSEKLIEAVTVSLSVYDASGIKIGNVEDYQYSDLNIKNGEYFGSNKAIIMPLDNVKTFSVDKIAVEMADGSIKVVSGTFIPLPEAQSLQSIMNNEELVKQYQLSTNKSAQFVPQEYKDLWLCSCGEWNTTSQCSSCKGFKTRIFDAFDLDILNEAMQKRLEIERQKEEERQKQEEIENQKQEERRRLAEIERRRKEKMYRRISLVTIPIISVAIISIALFFTVIQPNMEYDAAVELMNNGKYEEAIVAFEAMDGYKDSADQIVNCENGIIERDYQNAFSLIESGEYERAKAEFKRLKEYKDSQEMIKECDYLLALGLVENEKYIEAVNAFKQIEEYKDSSEIIDSCIETIYNNAVCAHENGNSQQAIQNFFATEGYKDSEKFLREIFSSRYETISAGDYHTVAIKNDGTVVAAGRTEYGRCDVSDWADIIEVSAGWNHIVGLKSDGTVVATGDNYYGQCDVSGWTNIISVNAGEGRTIGVKSDGTVVVTGNTVLNGSSDEISQWKNIIEVSQGIGYTIGLKADGTVVIAHSKLSDYIDTTDWTNIVAVRAGSFVLGIKSNGFVITGGGDLFGERYGWKNWHNFLDVYLGDYHSVFLHNDGRISALGNNYDGQCDVSNWTDIVAISAGNSHTVGLKANGTVVAVGENEDGQCYVSNWTDIRIPK